MKTFIRISPRGNFLSFEGDFSVPLREKRITRVSHVLPSSRFKRFLFRLLRRLFGDSGAVAEWTRRWRGPWVVTIGGRMWGPFPTRREAIEFERELVVRGELWRGM